MHPKHAVWPALLAVATVAAPAFSAPQVQILLPLQRTAYQTNEQIDISVVRSDTAALPAGLVTLTLAGDDASKMAFTFAGHAASLDGNRAHVTEHLHLNGWLLRPGKYTVTVMADDATATTPLTLVSHIRRSTFSTVAWGIQAEGASLSLAGEDSLGYNVLLGDYWKERIHDNGEQSLLGGADFMHVCTMGGAHQMDMRSDCDWSDPYVVRGGTARVVQQAQVGRTLSNQIGVHFYDEPGLTWEKHPVTGEVVPHNIRTQDDAYRKVFGTDPPEYYQVKPDDAASVARWNQLGRWKEEFMEAAWREPRLGVETVRPDYISITQSQYGWNAYTDGYYFNVARSLPQISGHGGYDDGPASYFYPSYTFEFGRMRDLNKPAWYLPSWYAPGIGELFRLEQNLSFQTNLQGMSTPPGLANDVKSVAMPSIVETNKLYSRLGTIFDNMPVTRGDVAILYSISQDLGAQIASGMKDNYGGGGHTRGTCLQVYLAGKELHIPFQPIVEEDVLDGTLAANHKAVIVAGINYLDPKVIAALEAFAASGGSVLITDDCKIHIKGATPVGAIASAAGEENIETIWAKDQKLSMKLRAATYFIDEAKPLAAALGAKLAAIGIKPVADCPDPEIAITRQAQGDFEYLFAVNATGARDAKLDAGAYALAIKPAVATIGLVNDGRPIYDAVRGGVPVELNGKATSAAYRFGAGEMRVFARTARPIGGVHVAPIALFRDFTVDSNPINVQIAATIEDTDHGTLMGAAPMRIKVVDPLDATRYDLYRATKDGVVSLTLPLAANDAAGQYKVSVTELLDNHTGTATFNYKPGAQCGAAAGASQRAVYFGNDRKKIYEFIRRSPLITIVAGKSDYDTAAAQRIATALKPWGVTATIVPAATVGARPITAEEAPTWISMNQGQKAVVGTGNSPYIVGWDIKGSSILVGNSADNPLIKFAEDNGFLAYHVTPDFPGTGRGYIGWQMSSVGLGQESATVIATDAAGMDEAAGTFYAAVAGLEPLTKFDLPWTASVTPATIDTTPAPPLPVAWEAILPDRATSLVADGATVHAYTLDGTLNLVDATGKLLSSKPAVAPPPAAATPAVVPAGKAAPYKIVKQVLPGHGTTAVSYWGGLVQTFDATWNLKSEQLLPQDVAAMTWQGPRLVVALSDGKLVGLGK